MDKSLFSVGNSFDLALPYSDDTPSFPFKFGSDLAVAKQIAVDFGTPEFFVGFRKPVITAALMTMPEAPVDEDHGFVLRKYNIRLPGQIGNMQTIAKPL